MIVYDLFVIMAFALAFLAILLADRASPWLFLFEFGVLGIAVLMESFFKNSLSYEVKL